MNNYLENIEDRDVFKQDIKNAIDQKAMEVLKDMKQDIASQFLKNEED